MFESPDSVSAKSALNGKSSLPLDVIVSTVCEAALASPELLYEAMLKLSLAVEAFAPTYGLSIWALGLNEPPRVKWAEGLNAEEIDEAANVVAATLGNTSTRSEVKAGDVAICLPLAPPSPLREGAAIYARCVRPLTGPQARNLRSIVDVAQLAHAYALAKMNQAGAVQAKPQSAAVCA